MSNHLSTFSVSREFIRAYTFLPEEKNPGWANWCGGGPLDNDTDLCSQLLTCSQAKELFESNGKLWGEAEKLESEDRAEFEAAFPGLNITRRSDDTDEYLKPHVESIWTGWKVCAKIERNRKDRAERLGLKE